jgi:glutamate formiminotransferase / 5-formyltetrahydrofolate cyclo-ligase
LLAIPNFSEGRDQALMDVLAQAARGVPDVRLLATHSDPDHHRLVLTVTGPQGTLHESLMRCAAAVIERVDLHEHDGVHPRVGVIDVAPIVFLDHAERGAACAEALTLADRLGSELELPVFLYGLLTEGRMTRANIRRGGPQALASRIAGAELTPDFGPRDRLHPTAGAVMVSARQPLVAFNVELAPPANLADARRIAALIREGGEEGLPSLRAIGLELPHRGGVAQVSMNIEDHLALPLAEVVAAIARHATPLEAELVGLAPRAAFEGFPDGLEVRNRRYVEDALDD